MNPDLKGWWYPPNLVILAAEELAKKYGQKVIDKDNLFKKVGEMKAAAILLLALHKSLKHDYYMQCSQEKYPDVYTLYQKEIPGKNKETKYQTVEVVTYEEHSKGEVADFILWTKLINPRKAYDEKTIILCYIRKHGTFIDFNQLYESMNEHKFKPSRVFIVGNTIENPNVFLLSQVWPIIHREKISYIDEVKNYPVKRRLTFRMGLSKKIGYESGPRHPIDPCEVFFIDKEKLEKKYKKGILSV